MDRGLRDRGRRRSAPRPRRRSGRGCRRRVAYLQSPATARYRRRASCRPLRPRKRRLRPMLRRRPAATASIGKPGSVMARVPSVTGAPGDGSSTLRSALQRELAAQRRRARGHALAADLHGRRQGRDGHRQGRQAVDRHRLERLGSERQEARHRLAEERDPAGLARRRLGQDRRCRQRPPPPRASSSCCRSRRRQAPTRGRLLRGREVSAASTLSDTRTGRHRRLQACARLPLARKPLARRLWTASAMPFDARDAETAAVRWR